MTPTTMGTFKRKFAALKERRERERRKAGAEYALVRRDEMRRRFSDLRDSMREDRSRQERCRKKRARYMARFQRQ